MRFLLILKFITISFLLLTGAIAQKVIAPIPMPYLERGTQEDNSPMEIETTPIAPEATINTPQPTYKTPQKLNLSAKISEDGPIIEKGIIWRIFDATTQENGQMSLIMKSDKPIASFELKPSEYLIHVAYGFAQTSEAVNITNSPITKEINLEAGALRLNSSITGDIAISPKNLWFDIYTSDYDSEKQIPVIKDVRANELIYLNVGTYHVVSRYGKVNAEVKADLRVEVGQLTQATLYHDASQISFRLSSEQRGKAIADVEWVVKDVDGNSVYTNLGAFPSAILSEGDYSVIAKIGQKVYNRDFQVTPAAPREIELLTSIYN